MKELNEIINFCGSFCQVNAIVYVGGALLGCWVGFIVGLFICDKHKHNAKAK